jgi:hypothetical protein
MVAARDKVLYGYCTDIFGSTLRASLIIAYQTLGYIHLSETLIKFLSAQKDQVFVGLL